YPCDFYVLDKYYEGNLNETPILDIIRSEKAHAFIKEDVRRPKECYTCKWGRICHGGCKRDLTQEEDGSTSNYYCSAFKFFFAYAQELLEKVARAEYEAKYGRYRH
ncbi:MAG: SPASM domain-containing protein, partial [Spirochaetales bacterium]|nr:SPASM domain-containing protein [Candidatus Physcosoma equi]